MSTAPTTPRKRAPAYGLNPLNELDADSPLHSPAKSRAQYAALHPPVAAAGALLNSPSKAILRTASPTRGGGLLPPRGGDLLSRMAAIHAPELLENVGPSAVAPPASPGSGSSSGVVASSRYLSPSRSRRPRTSGSGGGSGGPSPASSRLLAFLQSPAKPEALSYAVSLKDTAGKVEERTSTSPLPRHTGPSQNGTADAGDAAGSLRTPAAKAASSSSPRLGAAPMDSPLSPDMLFKHAFQSPLPPTVVPITRRLFDAPILPPPALSVAPAAAAASSSSAASATAAIPAPADAAPASEPEPEAPVVAPERDAPAATSSAAVRTDSVEIELTQPVASATDAAAAAASSVPSPPSPAPPSHKRRRTSSSASASSALPRSSSSNAAPRDEESMVITVSSPRMATRRTSSRGADTSAAASATTPPTDSPASPAGPQRRSSSVASNNSGSKRTRRARDEVAPSTPAVPLRTSSRTRSATKRA